MKIVHVSHHFFPCVGGIEKVVLEYCRQLKKMGFEQKVICLNKCPSAQKTLPKKETVEGIPVERLSFLDLKYYKIASRILEKIRDADIVHVHGIGFFSDILLLLKPLHGKKIVVTMYGAVFHTKNFSFLKKLYFFGLNRLLLHNAGAIVGISASDIEEVSKIAAKEKISVIEIGVNIEGFFGLKGKRKESSFVSVGRLSENKQLELLVKAFKIVSEKNKKAVLHIVGKDFGGTEAKLRELINSLNLKNNVFLQGLVSDAELKKILSETEFFVSASGFESFGISAVEAMAAGCIPILSPIPTFKSFVENGKNGFIVDFDTPKKAGEKLLEIIELDAKKKIAIADNAGDSSKRFSWQKSAEKLAVLYRRL